MKPEYQTWIDAYVAKHKFMRGRCVSATREMALAFPELKVVMGFAEGEHAWCVTPDGEIVDPTVAQFEGRTLTYKPFEPGDVVKVGKCMNCGNNIYAEVENLSDPKFHRSFCDDECKAAFNAYMDEEARSIRR